MARGSSEVEYAAAYKVFFSDLLYALHAAGLPDATMSEQGMNNRPAVALDLEGDASCT
jgi:hypothetical protein